MSKSENEDNIILMNSHAIYFVFCMQCRECARCRFFVSSRRRHTISKRDWSSDVCSSDLRRADLPNRCGRGDDVGSARGGRPRSEERRVGKESRTRWEPHHSKKKKIKK